MGVLRRIESGFITEDSCVTLHDLKDAFYQYRTSGDDSVIRKVVKLLELLLVGLPRIIIKDSSVSFICHGGQLTIKGIYKYDENLEPSKDVVLITAYGEAVALAKSLVYSEEIKTMNSGFITKTERVIMERELYPRCWGIMEEYQVYFKDKELV
ncbi:CBF5 [Hepatospora eriocheir]|uniref:CBF5 n=1 Tax=Hepatospora eriocheir TaxID=1081669 RepID=A0A1X0QFH6_9MICR|nr:CBF5 [Hepatospora eriocheir]